MRRPLIGLLAVLAAFQAGCGGGGSSFVPTPPTPPPPQVAVSINPSASQARIGTTQQFTATVTGTTDQSVIWAVNGIAGGTAALGTISQTGLYTSPAALPTPNSVTIQATSPLAPASTATASLTLLNPLPVLTLATPSVAGVGTFTLSVAGSGFVTGAQISFGGAAVATTFVSSTLLRATVTATPAQAQAGRVNVSVSNPDPGGATSPASTVQVVSGNAVTAFAAARFLEQATFGPTPELIAQVQQVGFTNFLTDQFNTPSSTYADQDPADNSSTPLQSRFFANAISGPDQLRQRVAFALHKIWVVSWVEVNTPQAFAPYLRMQLNHAFSNYRTIMNDVTFNPAMGRYQDVANNDKPDPARNINANENYGRELLQLFTVGTFVMNSDGTLRLDAQGNAIALYDPVETVQGFARAQTGWTYAPRGGQQTRWPNPVNYAGQLEPVDSHHDMNAGKRLIGGVELPAGPTAQQDMRDSLDHLFNQPNNPPHVVKLLIPQFVTSNPSPAYVARVVQAYISGREPIGGFGSGQRGDMRAVIAAILLDPEARRGDDPSVAVGTQGHLREPVLFMTGLMRAFGAQSDGVALIAPGQNMGQRILYPPTVFSYFPPDYLIPGTNLLGPEFQIQTTATTFQRINFVNTFAFGTFRDTTVNFSGYAALATDTNRLLNDLDILLLHGTMSPSMRASISRAINAVPASNPLQRARTAIYLVASSSQYQVIH